jgi:Hsp70 protein
VTLLTIDGGIFEVKSTSGDTHLGGEVRHYAQNKAPNALQLTCLHQWQDALMPICMCTAYAR